MTVWIELALIENFLIDGVLLYLALKCARLKVKVWRLFLAAALGAAEAVVFPILSLPVWAAYLVKALGGALLCLVATCSRRAGKHFIVLASFFALTFALGGALTALYSFMGVSYEAGAGYLVEQAPVGLVLGVSGVFLIVAARGIAAFYRYRKVQKNLLSCTLAAAGREVNWQGYADSGNLLTFRGKPVCVISAAACIALFGQGAREAGRIRLSTVNGGREAPVFECDKMTIETGKETLERRGVYLTVGDVGKSYPLILSTALMEA